VGFSDFFAILDYGAYFYRELRRNYWI